MSRQTEQRTKRGSTFWHTAEFLGGLTMGIGAGIFIGQELTQRLQRRRSLETHIPLIADPYANRADASKFLAAAPEIYRNIPFQKGIVTATGLQEGDWGRNIAELMSGTGTVGQAIAETYPGNILWYVDTSQAQLQTIIQSGASDEAHVIHHDIRNGLPSTLPKLDGVVVRFGIKNLSREEQQKVMRTIADQLVDGGFVVIADMVCPEGMQQWHNEERKLKHELEGHDVQKEGAGNIPYRDEWIALFTNAGLTVEIAAPYTSEVQTVKWKTSKQFAGTEEQQEAALERMNAMLLSSEESVREAFHIRKEGDIVQIDYPLLVFRARKKGTTRR